jgi:hypothetical protein
MPITTLGASLCCPPGDMPPLLCMLSGYVISLPIASSKQRTIAGLGCMGNHMTVCATGVQ